MSAREGRVLEPSLLVAEEACREREEEVDGVWTCVSLDDIWSEGRGRWIEEPEFTTVSITNIALYVQTYCIVP